MGITASIDISAEQRQLILALLNKYLPNTQVWAFGSRVKWTTRFNSDLDLVAFSSPQQDPQISALKEAFEESNLPFRVDLLVWDNLPENFQRNIQECYEVLVEAKKVEQGLGLKPNWLDMELGQFIELKRGYDLPKNNRETGSVPLVSSSGESDFHSVAKVSGPGVVTGRYGTIGKVFYIEEDFWPLNTTLYVRDFKGNDPLFVYYFLKTISYSDYSDKAAVPGINRNHLHKAQIRVPIDPFYQRELAQILWGFDKKIELNRQTNQTLEQIAQAIFKSWFVDFEPVKAKVAALNSLSPRERAGVRGKELAEQAAICAISGKTPEQLAQLNPLTLQQLKSTAALFPDALVDSELGEIPEGWVVSSIDDVCDFQNGYAFQSQEMSKSDIGAYKVFKMGGIKKGGGLNRDSTKDWYEKSKCEKLDRYVIKKGDLLMCMTDMKNNVALLGHTALMDVDNEYILNQRVGLLRTRNKHIANYPFLYILTNSDFFIEDLRSRANSGVQVNLSTKEIKETKFVLPDKNVHVEFDKVAVQLQEKIFSLEAEQDYLSELRDSLLPKLLSGEITLSNLDDAA
jgi:type I restriction enzyme, S subunit